MRWVLAAALLCTAGQAAAQRRAAPQPVQVPLVAPPEARVASVRAGVELWQAGQWAAAVAMWQPFAEGGNADAMFNLGQAYQLGRGVPRDGAAALRWYEQAAARGHRPALANQGIMLFKADRKTQALALLKRAADAGEPRAQYVYGTAAWNGDGLPRNLGVAYAYLARAAEQGLAEGRSALDLLAPRLSGAERANGQQLATTLARADGTKGPLAGVATGLADAAAAQEPNTEAGSGSGWWVQIGAFSSRSGAEADLAAISSRSPAVLSGLSVYFAPGGSLVRLQLGPFDSSEAARAGCARFAAVGRACLVVPPSAR